MNIKYIGSDLPWSLPFGDHHFNSSNSQNNTNELETIARRHGFEELISSQKTSQWSNAGVFFTNRTIDSNINGNYNTDFHDDHNHTFCYLCSINPHEHERTEPRDEYKRRKLIPYKNPKARLSSSLDRRVPNSSSSSSDLISYRFIIRTGTQKNSGTRAQVFLHLSGTEKNWSSIHLRGRMNENSSASIDGFPSGSVRTFCLKGPEIGQLHHLNVNLVGSRSDKEWFLKDIEVTNLKTSTTWLCEFNCWLPKTDGHETNQIKSSIHQHTELSLSIYILQIRTGERPCAGADGHIQIIVRGSTSQTHRLPLTSNRANLFEQNQLDTFAIVGSDLGELLEIIVDSDKSRLASDWDIKEMTMWKILPSIDDHQSLVYFPFNTWLGKKVNTLKAKREIYPLSDQHVKGPICYQVMVKTGKVMNAGTDANVFLIIYGKSGRTVIHQLDNRSKNDFERNTSSEFMIMDIDVGQIDRLKIWHDNANPGSAWFLDSVIIQKKYSISHTVSQIYIQRLEQISKVLYRQVHERVKENSAERTTPTNEHLDQQSFKSRDHDDRGFSDRLVSSRGILRSPTMYDRVSLQKKVRWDEQSIGSQDDLFSIDSQRAQSIQTAAEKKHRKEESVHHQIDHLDHQIYWISSHNYNDNKWKIKSIEEVTSFDIEQSVRAWLLSDRSTTHNKMKTSMQENKDEAYEFQANRWLAKDKEDGKLEVYLTPKSIQKSPMTSDANTDSTKKHRMPSDLRPDTHHDKYDEEGGKYLNESKRLSSYDIGPVEKSLRSSTLRDLPSSSSRSCITPKTHLSRLHPSEQSVDPTMARLNTRLKPKEESPRVQPSIDTFPSPSSLVPHANSSHDINNRAGALSSEQELLARLTGEPSNRPRTSVTSLSPLSQRSKSARSTNEQESSARISTPISMSSSSQHLKSSRGSNNLSTSLINTRDSLDRTSMNPSSYSRTKPPLTSSSNQRLKSSRDINDLTEPLSSQQEVLATTTDESLHRPRSSVTSLLSLDQRSKLPRNTNEHQPSGRIPSELPTYSQSTSMPMSPSSQHLRSSRGSKDLSTTLINTRDSLERPSGELPNYARSTPVSISTSSSRLKSPRNSTEYTSSVTGDEELLARLIGEPSHSSRSSAAPLPSFNQSAKLLRNSNDLINSSINEREKLAKLAPNSLNYPRSSASSLVSSSQLPKPTRSNTESANLFAKPPLGLSSRPTSAVRSNSRLSPQKLPMDQVHNSAYGKASSDDF